MFCMRVPCPQMRRSKNTNKINTIRHIQYFKSRYMVWNVLVINLHFFEIKYKTKRYRVMNLKKIHIVAIVGSLNPTSFTERFTQALLQSICETQEEITYQIVSLREWNLAYCRGCIQCFLKGYCVLDQIDGFDRLRNLLESADCIVFASPVYACGISGIMKTFIDRLSYSIHLLQYAGRLGFTITTTSSSGAEFVSSYLQRVQIGLGIKNLCNFSYALTKDKWDDSLHKATNQWFARLNNTFSFSSNMAEETFEYYKSSNLAHSEFCTKHPNVPGLPLSEIEFWTKGWAAKCKSFQEFAVKNKALNSQKNGETK